MYILPSKQIMIFILWMLQKSQALANTFWISLCCSDWQNNYEISLIVSVLLLHDQPPLLLSVCPPPTLSSCPSYPFCVIPTYLSIMVLQYIKIKFQNLTNRVIASSPFPFLLSVPISETVIYFEIISSIFIYF